MSDLQLRVRRTPPGQTPTWETYRVPRDEKMTVLDAVTRVQRTEAPDLAYRYACRVGMCGSCAMVINGRERWACRTLVDGLDTSVITVEPLRNLPVVKDLVVDMAPFFGAMARADAHFVPAEAPVASVARDPDAADVIALARRPAIDPHIECITCGACYSACTMVSWDPDYLGPAALNRVSTLVKDPRDGMGAARLAVVGGEHGCWRCHSQFTCTDVCPMQLRPTESIAHLKRTLVAASFGLGPERSRPSTSGGAGSSSPPTRSAWWRQLRAVAAAAVLALVVGYGYLAGAGPTPIAERTHFWFSGAPATIPAEARVGAAVFEVAGCERCHSVLGTGGRSAPDLWRTGGRWGAAELRRLLLDPDTVLAPGVMPSARGLPAEELEALVTYLNGLDLSRAPRTAVLRSDVGVEP